MNDIANPHPSEFVEKLRRIGWGNWTPTDGVTDEATELYVTPDGEQPLHVMSVAEAWSLSDDELAQRLREAWNA